MTCAQEEEAAKNNFQREPRENRVPYQTKRRPAKWTHAGELAGATRKGTAFSKTRAERFARQVMLQEMLER